MFGSVFLVFLLALSTSASRIITVKNHCSETLWPALFTDPKTGNPIPKQATGWKAEPGSHVSFEVADNWMSGRIWPRTQCDFSKDPGPTSCATGGCIGGLECDPSTGTGVPPATVAEFTLSDDSSVPDNYDVSVKDGYNVQMQITNSAGCGLPEVPSCPVNLNSDCPKRLQDLAHGDVAGCLSSCAANLDGDPNNSKNCCTGQYDTAPTCPNSTVAYYDYFKSRCPNAYAYAYDESSGTALWYCSSDKKADYTVEFCPPQGSPPPRNGSDSEPEQIVLRA
ncbi:Osmotin thaumatin-like protein [Mycena amicta]|nr:Osmotin thaumatin-like protein [Mycena amicta]